MRPSRPLPSATSLWHLKHVYVAIRKKARNHKLGLQWDGPYPIVSVPNRNVVQIEREGRKFDKVNVEHVRLYHSREMVKEEAITEHRVRVAADGCQEMQYERHQRYWPLRHLVRSFTDGWEAVQAYHEANDVKEENHVGELVYKDFDGDVAAGRVEYYDPDDTKLSVVYYDGFVQAMTTTEYNKQLRYHSKRNLSPMLLPKSVSDINTMLNVALVCPPVGYEAEVKRVWPRATVSVFDDAAQLMTEDGRTRYDFMWCSTRTIRNSAQPLPPAELVWGLVAGRKPRMFMIEGRSKLEGPEGGQARAHQVGRRSWVWTNALLDEKEVWLPRQGRDLAFFTELLARVNQLPSRSEWTLNEERFDWLQRRFGPFDVDACAREDGKNALLPRHWSPARPLQHQDGTDLRIYANPPFDDLRELVPTLMQKKGMSLTMILPEWKKEPWFKTVAPFVQHTWAAGAHVFKGPPGYDKTVRGTPWPVLVVHMTRENLEKLTKGSASSVS